ncbi:DUF932 domain-containing protein [Nocardia nova]|uniref:DUF932 domain-containing protein n=1 Tax=Nocardia nova TaxID=37330 RepID=A0A2S6AMN2_9NOCA|nr:DUF932 domain-containing protein [Nocardia nova]PPJ36456.1 DUF932 domain-containing protein [Nocardia nova]
MSPTGPATLPALPARRLRQADAGKLLGLLNQQQARKLDVVVPAQQLRIDRGYLLVEGADPHLGEDGVYDLNGLYTLTDSAVGDLATDFKIPVPYLRRCRTDNLRAFCNAINDWARRETDRKVLLRLLWGRDRRDKNSHGIVRAVLSDSYGFRDNLDMATVFLAGLREAGLDDTQVLTADMSDDHLYMRVAAPQIAVAAPELVGNYRSPFNQRSGADCPLVFAGVEFRNSETGHGKTMVAPQITIQICSNGMTFTQQALTQIHRGTRLRQGIVRWKADTYAADDHAFSLQIRDAVQSFLTPEFVQERVDEISGAAQVLLPEPDQTLTVVAKQLRFSEAERQGIWEHFLIGGDRSAGGIMHAVTSYAQVLADNGRIDRGNEFNTLGLNALRLAAANA